MINGHKYARISASDIASATGISTKRAYGTIRDMVADGVILSIIFNKNTRRYYHAEINKTTKGR